MVLHCFDSRFASSEQGEMKQTELIQGEGTKEPSKTTDLACVQTKLPMELDAIESDRPSGNGQTGFIQEQVTKGPSRTTGLALDCTGGSHPCSKQDGTGQTVFIQEQVTKGPSQIPGLALASVAGNHACSGQGGTGQTDLIQEQDTKGSSPTMNAVAVQKTITMDMICIGGSRLPCSGPGLAEKKTETPCDTASRKESSLAESTKEAAQHCDNKATAVSSSTLASAKAKRPLMAYSIEYRFSPMLKYCKPHPVLAIPICLCQF